MNSKETAALIGVGVAVAAVAGYEGWKLAHPSVAPSPSPVGTGAAPKVSLAFSGGPSGTIANPNGGRLPDLVTTLGNTGSTTATVTVSCPIQTAGGGATAFKWFAYSGQSGLTYNSDRSQVTVAVPAGGSVSVRWSTTWSGNPGTYQIVAIVEGSGVPTQTFTDSQTFTIQSETPAQAQVAFSGGPSGAVSGQQGQTQHLGPLTTVLQNVGETTGSFTISVVASGPAPATWYTTYGLSSGASGVPQVTVSLAPGQSVSIDWYTDWTFEASNAGTYQNVATVSW